MAINEKERLAQAWLAFASASVAGLSHTTFDEDGEVLCLDPDDIVEDACEIATKMTRKFASIAIRGVPEDDEDEEDSEDEEDEPRPARRRRAH